MDKSDKKVSDIIHNKMLLDKINSVGITTLGELCSYSQKGLINKGIERLYVKDIVLALQCNGMDLRKK